MRAFRPLIFGTPEASSSSQFSVPSEVFPWAEPNLLLPGKKPVGPVKLKGGIAHDLKSFGLIQKHDLYDLKAKTFATYYSNTPDSYVDQYGPYLHFNDTRNNEAVLLPLTDADTNGWGALTVFLRCRFHGSANAAEDTIFGHWSNVQGTTDNGGKQILWRYDSNNQELDVFFETSTGSFSGSLSVNLNDNKVHNIVLRWDGGAAHFFVDGVNKGTACLPTGTLAGNSGGSSIEVMGGHNVTRIVTDNDSPRFDLYSWGVWDRALNDSEIASLKSYAVVDLAHRPLIFPGAGGGGPTYTIPADQGTYTLTGQAVGLLAARVLTATQASYVLSGQDAGLTKTYVLQALQGAFGIVGQDANLLAQRIVFAAQGTYSLTGQDATLLAQLVLGATAGTYTMTGQDVDLSVLLPGSYTLTADQGAYTLAGQAANLLASRILTAAQGSYSVVGQDAGLAKAFIMAASEGSYTLTGQEAALLASRILEAETGSYIMAGQDAGLSRAFILVADTGIHSLTGQDVQLLASRILSGEYGVYTLTGQDAILTYSEAGSATNVASITFSLATRSISFTLKTRDSSFNLH